MSLSMMPPCMVARVGFWCFLATLMPSTMTLPLAGQRMITSPSLPWSLPVSTRTRSPFLIFMHHSTSGASETMRMNFLSRSSRPTGPKMRVPRGCCSSLMSTAAFSSKRM